MDGKLLLNEGVKTSCLDGDAALDSREVHSNRRYGHRRTHCAAADLIVATARSLSVVLPKPAKHHHEPCRAFLRAELNLHIYFSKGDVFVIERDVHEWAFFDTK